MAANREASVCAEHALIRIIYKENKKFCKINLTGLTKESFMSDGEIKLHIINSYERKTIVVLLTFLFIVSMLIGTDENLQMKVFDHVGCEIPMEFLAKIIRRYENGENFYLQIKTREENHELNSVATANVWIIYSENYHELITVFNLAGTEESSHIERIETPSTE